MEWMILSALMPSIVSGVVVGLVLRGWDKKQKDHAEQEAAQEKQRLRSENVRISLLVAAAKLSYAVAMAHKRGYPNGEIEAGVAQYQEAMREFREFERELLAEKSADV